MEPPVVFLYDLTMPEILRRIAAALIHAGLHGGMLAAILWLMGDKTARQNGWLTLNPFHHLRLSGVFLTIAFRINWITPPPFGAARWRPLVAVLISLGLLLLLVPLLDLSRAPLHQMLPRGAGYMVLATIDTLQVVLVGSVAMALLPLPGLLIGSTLPCLWPGRTRRWRRWQGIGLALAAIIVILGWFPDIAPLVTALRLV